jgi:ligand-binding sensor domain-containing protein
MAAPCRLLFLLATWLFASTAFPSVNGGLDGTLPIRVYRDIDGLPQNTVHAITLDHEGLLWVGTQDGAAVWDGRAWQAVPMPDRATSNFVRTILASRDGSLWFGTQAGGLHRRSEGRWERHEPRVDGLPAARVNHLAELDGLLLVATHEAGIATFDGSRWQRLTVADGLPTDRVWRLAPGSFGGSSGAWAACEGGVVFVDPRSNRVISDPNFPKGHANSVVVLNRRGAEEVWVGTYGNGVFRFAGDGWQNFGSSAGLENLFVTSLAVDAEGQQVWVGTDGGGAARWDDGAGRFEVLTSAVGLPSDAVYSLLATSTAEGAQALWVGTRNGGLARVRELGWRALRPVPESPEAAVTALAEEISSDGSSALWFGTDGAGLVRRDATSYRRWDTAAGLPNGFVQALAVAGSGSERQVWVGLRNGGLVRIDAAGRIVEQVNASGGELPHDLVQAIALHQGDGGPELWIGTREGLAIRRGASWHRIPGLPPVSITDFEPSADGAMWVGSAVGILRVEGERFSIIDQRNGLRNTGILHLLETNGPDGEPQLWAGTDGGGLALFSGGDTPQLLAEFNEASEPPLPNDVVSGLAKIDDQTLFVLSNRGVAEMSLSDPAVRYGPSVHVHVSGPEDGLPALAGNRAAILVDRQRRLWVGTVEGAAALDLGVAQREDRQPKRLVLRSITVDQAAQTLAPGAGVQMGPEDRTVRIEYALLSFFREHDSRYRSQLIGVEDQPGAWTSQSSRELTGLPAGVYSLQIQGRDFEGNLSVPLEVPIVVAADLWSTAWVRLAPALAVALLALGALELQRRRARRQAEALEQRITELEAPARRTRRALIACGLADPLTGTPNDEVLSLLSRRPTPAGASLLLFGLRDTTTPLAEAAVFEETAAETLARLCPEAEVGRFDVGVVWAWLPTADPHNPRRWLDSARADLSRFQTVGAYGTADPSHVAELPERIADAFAGARRTGVVTAG